MPADKVVEPDNVLFLDEVKKAVLDRGLAPCIRTVVPLAKTGCMGPHAKDAFCSR